MNYTQVDHKAGERLERQVALADITVSHNPRWPVRVLQEALESEGYGDYTENPLGLVHDLALGDAKKKSEFVRLIETYEAEPRQVVELAASRRRNPLQAISLRSFRKIDLGSESRAYVERYGLIAGERRLLAAAYNHAKHGDPASIGATICKMTVGEAEDLAFDENFQRADMLPLEMGNWLRRKYDQIRAVKAESKINYSLKQLAKDRQIDYQFLRSRIDLTYLPEKLQVKLNKDRLGLTRAAQVGREIRLGKRNGDGSPKENGQPEVEGKKNGRTRTLTVAKIRSTYDESRGESPEFLRGLAFCMGLSLEQAEAESDTRIEQAEDQEAARRLQEIS